MSINTEAIIKLIQERPEIRTVEIADIIDCDPELIEPALRVHIATGKVTVIPVTAPNGRPANGFIYNAPRPPVFANQVKPDESRSKVQSAIRYVVANGLASGTDLRRIMGLTERQSPLSYLGGPLKDGRLRKHGVNYYPGPALLAKENSAPAPIEATTKPAPKPAAVRPPRTQCVNTFSATAGNALTDPVPAAFRVGIWSDGVLEFQRAGQTLARLTIAEQAVVAEFTVKNLIKHAE